MSKPASSTYRTTNWRACNAALTQRGSARGSGLTLRWSGWRPRVAGAGARPPSQDAATQTCLMLKALFGLPLRQATGLVASLLRLAKLDWPVPDFSTLCRRQDDLTVTNPLP